MITFQYKNRAFNIYTKTNAVFMLESIDTQV